MPPYETRGRVVDVEGTHVYLDCRGAGSPTVILENGAGGGAGGWGEPFDAIASFARVCAWDRPGLGRTPSIGTHSAGETAALLAATLVAAGERGPFVVVAHSFGAAYARLFAKTTDSAPAGAVLAFLMLDPYEPDLGMDVDPSLPEATRAAIRESLDGTAAMLATAEDLDWGRTMAELADAGAVRQPTILLTVDPAARFANPDATLATLLVDSWHRSMAARYVHATFEVAANSGHVIHYDRPDLVIADARALVEAYRNP